MFRRGRKDDGEEEIKKNKKENGTVMRGGSVYSKWKSLSWTTERAEKKRNEVHLNEKKMKTKKKKDGG